MKEKYPWLEQDVEWRNMSNREILDKYIDLDKSCVSGSEKKQVMDICEDFSFCCLIFIKG